MRLRAARPVPIHRAILGILAVGAVLVAPGCSSDGSESDASGGQDAEATETTASTAVPSDTVAEPEVVMVRSYATPRDAGKDLFAAWLTGDAAVAAGMAPPEAVFELFSIGAGPSAKNRGCDDGEFGSASCFFSNGQGGVNVALTPGPEGWQIATIDSF